MGCLAGNVHTNRSQPLLRTDDPVHVCYRREVRHAPAPDLPPVQLALVQAAGPQQGLDLADRPRPQGRHPAVEHEDEGQDGHDPAPEQRRRAPPAPRVLGRGQQDAEAEQAAAEEALDGAVLELEYGEALRGLHGVTQDGPGEGVVEVVEG